MICITLGNNEKPIWWNKFIEYAFVESDNLRVIDGKEWAKTVNEALMSFGGRIQRNWTKNYYFITFREEFNYTLFVLKFS